MGDFWSGFDRNSWIRALTASGSIVLITTAALLNREPADDAPFAAPQRVVGLAGDGVRVALPGPAEHRVRHPGAGEEGSLDRSGHQGRDSHQ